MQKYPLIRKLYLYLFSGVGLVVTVIGCVSLINLGLKIFIFKQADIYPVYEKPRLAPLPDGKFATTTEEQQQKELERDKEIQKQETTRRRQDQAANALAMIIVGLPLYLYHWYIINKDKKDEIEYKNDNAQS